MAVGSLMMRLWPRVGYHAFVSIRERTNRSEVFLSLICVDLLAVELRVLREDLWLYCEVRVAIVLCRINIDFLGNF